MILERAAGRDNPFPGIHVVADLVESFSTRGSGKHGPRTLPWGDGLEGG